MQRDIPAAGPARPDTDKARTVLNAARTVFLAHGFSAATTDMIQREAGVSKSTVYAYYPNKEALFIGVVEAECAVFMKTLSGIEFHPGELRETLARLARAYLDVVLSQTALALFRVVVAEAPRLPQLARNFYEAGPGVTIPIVAEQLALAAEAGEIDLSPIGLEPAATAFITLVRGEAQLQCLTHPGLQPPAAQMDQWVSVAVTTFLRAYGRGHTRNCA